MKHKLLQNITEYRNWAWSFRDEENENIDQALGLCPVYSCWDSIEDENGNWVDIDEDGNVIPEDTAETIKLDDWVYGLEFPVIAIYWFEQDDWRGVSHEICACDFVSLSEFSPSETPKELEYDISPAGGILL